MTEPAKFDDLLVGDRTYIPVLRLDPDGRPVEWKIRTDSARRRYAAMRPYLCPDCSVLVLDPAKHNEAHDGPSCSGCGCTTDNPCFGGCYWVDDRLCSRCAGEWLCVCGHPNLDHNVADNGLCTVTCDDPGIEWAECPCTGLEKAG